MTTVLLTDFAWPDDSVERAVVEGAGFDLVSGPSAPAQESEIDALALACSPAAIMTCWARVSALAMQSSPNLAVVQRLGVGLDNIDVEAATARGVLVTNVPDYCVEEVSDHAVGMLLAWARGIVAFDSSVKGGVWAPETARLRRVRELTVGLLGLGRIGRRTAEKLAPFGARLVAFTPSGSQCEGVASVDLEGLLADSDVVILHAPLNATTRGLFSHQRFAQMKPGAFLINVSRGQIVDNGALADALEAGRLAGAALDVIDGEPDPPARLRARADVILTPHIGFSSDASLRELRRRGAEEVVRVLRGDPPQHPCNAPHRAPGDRP